MKLIKVTGEQRQRYLLNLAKIGVGVDGTQFEARMDLIALLISVNPVDLTEHFEDIHKKLADAGKAVSIMVSYKSDIKKRILKQSDVTSYRFLKYRESLALCYEYLFLLEGVWKFLVKGTELENMTVPSNYWAYVIREEYDMKSEKEDLEDEEMH
jgi:hypothetical protein